MGGRDCAGGVVGIGGCVCGWEVALVALELACGCCWIVVCLCWLSGMWLGGTVSPGGVVGFVVCGGGWEGQRVALELACSTDDQRRATKQEQANLCVVSVLCAST